MLFGNPMTSRHSSRLPTLYFHSSSWSIFVHPNSFSFNHALFFSFFFLFNFLISKNGETLSINEFELTRRNNYYYKKDIAKFTFFFKK